MTTINPYLTFNGNCREAMRFYKDCFGGELILQSIGDSPMADQMPAKMKDCILHAMLNNDDNVVLMGTDCIPEGGLVKGNGVSLNVMCNSEEQIRLFYKKLAAGGEITFPLNNSFWGTLFGGLTDRYGNYWMLNYEKH